MRTDSINQPPILEGGLLEAAEVIANRTETFNDKPTVALIIKNLYDYASTYDKPIPFIKSNIINEHYIILDIKPITGEPPAFGKIQKFFKKAIKFVKQRTGRDGKAIEVTFKDGTKIDITKTRVKEWAPKSHPQAPPGTLQKIKFEKSLPGSKGFKRKPTQKEIDALDSF